MPIGPAVKPGLSPRDVALLYDSARDANKTLAARRDASPTKKVAEKALDAVEVAAGAAAVGFVAGRTGSTTLGPIPTGLAVAAAYYTAEALDLVPASAAPHLENVFGKGALAGFAAMWAAGQGYLMKQDAEAKAAGAEKKPPAKAAGEPPPGGWNRVAGGAAAQMGCGDERAKVSLSNHLTEAELVAIKQRRRYGR